jgi:hypothetical protein
MTGKARISGAVLRIEVEQKDSLCWLVFRTGGRPLKICSVPWDQVAEARSTIRAALEEFHGTVGDDLTITDFSSLEAALAELDQTGKVISGTTLGRFGGGPGPSPRCVSARGAIRKLPFVDAPDKIKPAMQVDDATISGGLMQSIAGVQVAAIRLYMAMHGDTVVGKKIEV